MKVGTVFRLREPRGGGYVYDLVECVGEHALSEHEREVVLAPLSGAGFGPVFSVDPGQLHRAGYELDVAESEALQARRAEAAAAVEAARTADVPKLPWEGSA